MVHKVAPFVDIIEAGTPLIKQEGLRIISILKECFPEKLILADMKTMDAGGLEAKLAYDAGADLVTVLAVATTPPSEVPWRWPTGEANGWWST